MAKDTAGKLEDVLRELGKKIDHLIDEAKDAKDEIRDDLEEKIQDLKAKKDKIEEDIHTYKDSEKWQETKEEQNLFKKFLKRSCIALAIPLIILGIGVDDMEKICGQKILLCKRLANKKIRMVMRNLP